MNSEQPQTAATSSVTAELFPEPVAETPLFIPDRFELLKRHADHGLGSVVMPVRSALNHLNTLRRSAEAARRGAFMILRGTSGSGKTTFLNTVNLFLDDVEIESITRKDDIQDVLRKLPKTQKTLRLVVIEGRDALRAVSDDVIDGAIHEINAFTRSPEGEKSIVVWAVNDDDLQNRLKETAERVGGDSLLGVANPIFHFDGPPKEHFIDIARNTIAALNQGASLADLGVTEVRAEELTRGVSTIGQYLGKLRDELLRNQAEVGALVEKERYRLWVVVVAGNDPEGDVAGLTRGTLSTADIERLMSATEANVVKDLKEFPEKLGILGTLLDAKILYLPTTTALAVAREFASEKLIERMKTAGMSLVSDDAIERVKGSSLARAFERSGMGIKATGRPPGSNSKEAFAKLAGIARTDDGLLNEAVAKALAKSGLVDKSNLEKEVSTSQNRRTDIACETKILGTVRLEMMWRATTGRAEIANYTLTKLYNYGKAIGLFERK